jgi:putative ABC transport system permease protein
MLENYIKIALRNIRHQKIYTYINVSGLAIGIACAILILLYVADEMNFDMFHTKADQIYRVVEVRTSPDRGDQKFGYTAAPVGNSLVQNFPEIMSQVRLLQLWRVTVKYEDRRFYEGNYLLADSGFFDMFDFQLLRGNPQTALHEPGSVVLTETSAQKYFGDEDPMGKILQVEAFGAKKVTGILKDIPENSHLDFSMLFPFSTIRGFPWGEQFLGDWHPDFRLFITYLQIRDDTNIVELESKFPRMLKQHQNKEKDEIKALTLQALRDVHFNSGHITEERNKNKGDVNQIYTLLMTGLFILVIACINYMNLSTSRFLSRAKEIGLRKVAGAQRTQLIGQFLSESVILAAISTILAVFIIIIVLPFFNSLAEKELQFNLTDNIIIPSILILITLLVGLIAGIYPAFFLSGFRPAAMFDDRLKFNSARSGPRRALVIFQFGLSILLIIATVVGYRQLDYIQTKRLGYRTEQMITVDINSRTTRQQFKTIKQEFSALRGVQSVSVSSRVPGDWKIFNEIQIRAEGKTDQDIQTMVYMGIDQDFFSTYEIYLMNGRNFSEEFQSDSSAFIINQAAVLALGLDDPLGKRLDVPTIGLEGGGTRSAQFSGRIIGVVSDFHFKSLHQTIQPLVFGYVSNPIDHIDYYTIRVAGDNITEIIPALKTVNEKFDPEHPFEYNFLDERLKDFYLADIRVSQIFTIAASLAIIIACLGLFGLASFSAQKRSKEIAIRKVSGATIQNIVLLLCKDFSKWVLIANIIAWPAAWWLMNQWLQEFAYRVSLSWWIFIVAAAAALVIALVSVSLQAFRAAVLNPVEALKYE